ncbi:MAG: hypothetical protein KDA37_05375, partial [Planctomycetales bacterium]|nr:hypothetical protein [Planctomycetales bacterium]
MRRACVFCTASLAVTAWLCCAAWAERITTNPATVFGDPSLQFNNIAITPDGTSIVLTGLFNGALTGDRVYSLPVPNNPATDTVALSQLSSQSFSVNQLYDVAFPPVISPNGSTILYTHDNGVAGVNTIYKMPIG